MEHLISGGDLNNVVATGQYSIKTLDLRTVSADDLLKITFEETGDIYTFSIIRPAQDILDSKDDSALAWMPGTEWTVKCKDKNEKVNVLIGGACTANPGQPLLMTMLHVGHITIGRNLVIWEAGTTNYQVFTNHVSKIEVIKAKKQ